MSSYVHVPDLLIRLADEEKSCPFFCFFQNRLLQNDGSFQKAVPDFTLLVPGLDGKGHVPVGDGNDGSMDGDCHAQTGGGSMDEIDGEADTGILLRQIGVDGFDGSINGQ